MEQTDIVAKLSAIAELLDTDYNNLVDSILCKFVVEHTAGLNKDLSLGVPRQVAITMIVAPAAARKIQAIKAVRSFTGEGLKESKEYIDKADPGPSILPINSGTPEQYNDFKRDVEAAGYAVKRSL